MVLPPIDYRVDGRLSEVEQDYELKSMGEGCFIAKLLAIKFQDQPGLRIVTPLHFFYRFRDCLSDFKRSLKQMSSLSSLPIYQIVFRALFR